MKRQRPMASPVLWAVLAALLLMQPPALAYEIIRPGPNAWKQLLAALNVLQPGDVLGLSPGVFRLQGPLVIPVEGVELRGAGSSRTILSFAPGSDAQIGLHVRANGVRLSGLSVQDASGAAIMVQQSVGVSLEDLRLEWTLEDDISLADVPVDPPTGLVVSSSQDVLITDLQVRGVAGVGINIRNSSRVLVHKSLLQENALGIRVTDSDRVDIRDSRISHNGIGVWVLDAPNTPRATTQIRLFNNEITNNSDFRFSLQEALADTPPFGTGLAISSAQLVEIYANRIGRHGTTNLLIGSAGGNRHPDQISIHGNSFGASGYAPDLQRAEVIVRAASGRLAAIIWDGISPWPEVLGLQSRSGRIVIGHNQGADFVNLNLPWMRLARAMHNPDRNATTYSGTVPPLPSFHFATAHLRVPTNSSGD